MGRDIVLHRSGEEVHSRLHRPTGQVHVVLQGSGEIHVVPHHRVHTATNLLFLHEQLQVLETLEDDSGQTSESICLLYT